MSTDVNGDRINSMTLMRRYFSIVLTAVVVIGVTWFFVFYDSHAMARIPLKINDVEIRVEVARTEEERSVGLGGRESLGKNKGMLFVFDKESFYVFWMKDMLFPIDIIWINRDKKIVDVITNLQMETYPDFKYINDFFAQYVLEVNAGFFDAHDWKVGDTVEFSLEE